MDEKEDEKIEKNQNLTLEIIEKLQGIEHLSN